MCAASVFPLDSYGHTGLVTQTIGAFVHIYFKSIFIFPYILDTVSFWNPVYLNFRLDFFYQTSMNARAKAMTVT